MIQFPESATRWPFVESRAKPTCQSPHVAVETGPLSVHPVRLPCPEGLNTCSKWREISIPRVWHTRRQTRRRNCRIDTYYETRQYRGELVVRLHPMSRPPIRMSFSLRHSRGFFLLLPHTTTVNHRSTVLEVCVTCRPSRRNITIRASRSYVSSTAKRYPVRLNYFYYFLLRRFENGFFFI